MTQDQSKNSVLIILERATLAVAEWIAQSSSLETAGYLLVFQAVDPQSGKVSKRVYARPQDGMAVLHALAANRKLLRLPWFHVHTPAAIVVKQADKSPFAQQNTLVKRLRAISGLETLEVVEPVCSQYDKPEVGIAANRGHLPIGRQVIVKQDTLMYRYMCPICQQTDKAWEDLVDIRQRKLVCTAEALFLEPRVPDIGSQSAAADYFRASSMYPWIVRECEKYLRQLKQSGKAKTPVTFEAVSHTQKPQTADKGGIRPGVSRQRRNRFQQSQPQ